MLSVACSSVAAVTNKRIEVNESIDVMFCSLHVSFYFLSLSLAISNVPVKSTILAPSRLYYTDELTLFTLVLVYVIECASVCVLFADTREMQVTQVISVMDCVDEESTV